jgi:hypothetical protein
VLEYWSDGKGLKPRQMGLGVFTSTPILHDSITPIKAGRTTRDCSIALNVG